MKQATVVSLYSRTISAEALAKKVGVSRPTTYAWKTQFLGAEAPAKSIRNKSPPLDPKIAELERQRDALLRDIRELIKKDIGGDLQSLSNREKTMLIVAPPKTSIKRRS